MGRWFMVLGALIGASVLLACGGRDARTGGDAGRRATVDGSAPTDSSVHADGSLDGSLPTDAGTATDAGALTVSCGWGQGPRLLVTRPTEGAAGGQALLRMLLRFDGAASGIVIDSVRELLGDRESEALVRDWNVDTLRPPEAFDGRASPRPGFPHPTLLFTALADATSTEAEACDGPAWERRGRLEVSGRTDEGPFEVSCGLGTSDDDEGPVAFSCALGVSGWLGNTYEGLSSATTPSPAVFMESALGIYGSGPEAITNLSATSATVTAHAPWRFGEPCPSPEPWTPSGGMHDLWQGRSSADAWAGPVLPGTEEEAHWFWQKTDTIPTGFCSPSGSSDECAYPTLQLHLGGTSDQGPWQWESDLFKCYERGD